MPGFETIVCWSPWQPRSYTFSYIYITNEPGPLQKKSGHCLENDAGSQWEDADTATSSTMVEMISPSSNVDPFTTPKTRTRLSSKSSGHCLEYHNRSHSENRDKAKSDDLKGLDLNLLENQVDRIW